MCHTHSPSAMRSVHVHWLVMVAEGSGGKGGIVREGVVLTLEVGGALDGRGRGGRSAEIQ